MTAGGDELTPLQARKAAARPGKPRLQEMRDGALAVAVTTRCDSCIAAHAKAAREAGVTEAELADALGTAIALNAGAAYSYAFRTLEAFQQFEPST
jgi:AhpD family alkylhydroperoxidase